MDSDPAAKENGKPVSSLQTSAYSGAANPIVLYDGVCGLCNRTVQFASSATARAYFDFASPAKRVGLAHSRAPWQRRVRPRHGVRRPRLRPRELGKVGKSCLCAPTRCFTSCVGCVASGVCWEACSTGFRGPFGIGAMATVARIRYRVFGKYDTCPIPSAETRARFSGPLTPGRNFSLSGFANPYGRGRTLQSLSD